MEQTATELLALRGPGRQGTRCITQASFCSGLPPANQNGPQARAVSGLIRASKNYSIWLPERQALLLSFPSMEKKNLSSPADRLPVPMETITRRIYLIRGQRVMLDSDLADLYQVTTGNLNLAVRRNTERFPEDFMFQLTKDETQSLLLQSARAKTGRGGRQTPPYAFTELGVAMLSSVLNSDRAVQMNILIMRAFVKMRELLATHKDLAAKIGKLEAGHRDHTIAIGLLAKDIQALGQKVMKEFKKLRNPLRKKPRIGFYTGDK
jgi:hypothetical protein